MTQPPPPSDDLNAVYAVIMAGGAGTRFWPASRRKHPKQLLPLSGTGKSLLQETIERIAPLVPVERVLIVTGEHLVDPIAAELPELPTENVLAEPSGRNTAPCVAWAAATVQRRDENARLMVLPADHHIGKPDAYRDVLRLALSACDDGSLVTVGLTPTRPETGYGYLELDEALAPGLHAARRFVEKPDRRRAEQFIATGQFLWNSGMFFFRADAILRAISTHLPSLASAMQRFDEAATRGEEADVVAREYGELPSVSIDHGVMEKSSGVKVAVGDFEWSDLGSWATAYELSEKGAGENAFEGDVLAHNAKRNLVRAPEGKVVALVGVDDLVVVDTGDALLITPREGCQDVREIVAQLRKRNDNRL